MIKRYLRSGGTGSSGISTFFQSNVLDSTTATSVTYTSTVKGAVAAVVTIKVTTLGHSNPGYSYTVDGVSYVLNDTFTRTLDGSGLISFVQFADVGTSVGGNAIDVILTLESSTNGTIVPPNTTNIGKTT